MPVAVKKLDTYEGVFVPTTLNVLSILIYLRFGFIVGQAGISGSLLLLALSYTINLLTTMSVSAIATNGTVQGGGAYFMISRSLGPEFGGSIGVVFYIGQVLNAALNVVGFSDPLLAKFGEREGTFAKVLPESATWAFIYETILLIMCTIVCLNGPQMFARSSKLLFQILLVATLAVPLSTLVVRRYFDTAFDAWYTGPSWTTTVENWWPEFTKGAAGGEPHRKENFRSLFGIFFSATAGILAGASMSGDLERPSRSIPRGTLWGLLVTFGLYASVIIALGTSVSRTLLRRDVDVISSIDISPALVMLGEFATSIFSALMGIVGAAKLLQAIARDDIVPFIGRFARGSGPDDNPLAAILLTYGLTQLIILLDVNQIAVYITMAFLMTFVVLNLACFLLETAAAPNFRPSFQYFNGRTAFSGFVCCIGAMLAADMMAALAILLVGVVVFIVIHSYAAPKPWGDVSQSIIYHQVRKYLLKLKQDHVKYWRPQILLMVDDPRSGWQLIRFCNYLKKGGLFILGHVVIVKDNFQHEAGEVARQRSSWEKLRDMQHIKAFFQISASPSIVWGVRNVFLGSGLGGMRPNITVLGFFDQNETGQHRELVDIEALPTDNLRKEKHLTLQQWVQIIEDLLTMGSNVCVARGFMDAELPAPTPIFKWPWQSSLGESSSSPHLDEQCGYLDLYPIQMSARLMDAEGNNNGLSINYDTYTLILQLGSILHSVKAWAVSHQLRVVAFVEKQSEVTRETDRITELLDALRIQAKVVVRSLDTDNEVYSVIVKGTEDKEQYVAKKLAHSKWWNSLSEARAAGAGDLDKMKSEAAQHSPYIVPRVLAKKRRTLSSLQQLGVAHSMQATRWPHEHLDRFYDDQSSDSDSDNDSDSEDDDHSAANTNSANVVSGNTIRTLGDSAIADEEFASSVDSRSTTKPPQRADSRTNSAINEEVGPSFQDEPMDASELSVNCRDRSRSPTPGSGPGLRFNDLPASSQHLILNCMMREVSKNATVIFTTLPAPALGTHAEEAASRKYIERLQLLSDGLPPIALVHAQSMTVTTDL